MEITPNTKSVSAGRKAEVVARAEELQALARTMEQAVQSITTLARIDEAMASRLLALERRVGEQTDIRWLGQKIDGLRLKAEATWKNTEFLRTHLSTYVGENIVLTYLPDETPIFVNSNDIGGPMNFINGGEYEEDNLEALLSFLRPDSVFLDIGANLGFYTLQIAKRLRRANSVMAFEPHPLLVELMKRSLYLNGLKEFATVSQHGLSDRDGTMTVHYPVGHLGGGTVAALGQAARTTDIETQVRRFDSIAREDFSCDLVKIDVETHELAVLHGMKRTIENSGDIKILIEKLELAAGCEKEIMEFLAARGLCVYGVHPGARLARLSLSEFEAWSGYVLAARESSIGGQLERARLTVYPRQLFIPHASRHHVSGRNVSRDETGAVTVTASGKDALLFHGPYWRLKKGVWKVTLDGSLAGTMLLKITERYGDIAGSCQFDESHSVQSVAIGHDLVNFECAGWAASPGVTLHLNRIEFERVC